MNKTIISAAAAVLCAAAVLTAAPFEESAVLPLRAVKEIHDNGVAKQTLDKGETQLLYCPLTPLAKEAASFSENASDEDPTFVAESLHVVKKSELGQGAADTSLDTVSKIMRSISKMKGMLYFSNSRQKWEVLYSESYMVDDVKSKKAVPDKTEGSADGRTFYCFQDEHTFGDCIYRLDYRQTENEVSVQFTNEQALYYKFIKAVKPGNMKINLVVSDLGDSYAVYMVMHANIRRFSILEKRMHRSLNSRLDAIYKWFTEQF